MIVTTSPSCFFSHVVLQDQGWYSFTHGPITIVMLATEFEIGPGSDQFDFLNQTLSAVNRSVTPWVFVLGHRPM